MELDDLIKESSAAECIAINQLYNIFKKITLNDETSQSNAVMKTSFLLLSDGERELFKTSNCGNQYKLKLSL
ncbi:hypothetical protein ACTXT7_006104 [Hymenolepis weldensis]